MGLRRDKNQEKYWFILSSKSSPVWERVLTSNTAFFSCLTIHTTHAKHVRLLAYEAPMPYVISLMKEVQCFGDHPGREKLSWHSISRRLILLMNVSVVQNTISSSSVWIKLLLSNIIIILGYYNNILSRNHIMMKMIIERIKSILLHMTIYSQWSRWFHFNSIITLG